MIQTVKHILKQWFARALSLCVVGPICAMLLSRVDAFDGSEHTTFLTGSSFAGGFMCLLAVLGLILVMGAGIGRLVDRREGLLNIGFVLGWVAWSSGRMGMVYRMTPESGVLLKLAVEGVIVMTGITLTLMLMSDPKKGTVAGHGDDVSRFDAGYLQESITSKAGMLSMGVAVVVSLVFAVLFGQTDLPGQSVGVGFLAGVFAGVGGTLVAASARKDEKSATPTAFAPIMLGVMLCGVIAPLIGLIKPGAGELLGLAVKGDLLGFLIVSPMAWSMGAMLGVPMGHSWVEHSANHATAAGTQAV